MLVPLLAVMDFENKTEPDPMDVVSLYSAAMENYSKFSMDDAKKIAYNIADGGNVEGVARALFNGNTEAATKFIEKFSGKQENTNSVKKTKVKRNQNNEYVPQFTENMDERSDFGIDNPVDNTVQNGYNNNRGDMNVYNQEGVRAGVGESAQINTRGQKTDGRNWREDEETFTARNQGNTEEAGRRGRVLLKLKNQRIAYTPSSTKDGHDGGKVATLLKRCGIETVYVDGDIEIHENGVTRLHSQGLTTPDGKVVISSNATATDVELAAHEAVHVNDIWQTEAYINYESVIRENVCWNSDKYSEIAAIINNGHYSGRYDIQDFSFSTKFVRELAAYVNQFVVTDIAWAKEKFAELFNDWDAVVDASRQFNKDIGADFSESAFSIDENGASQSGTKGITEPDISKDTRSHEERVAEMMGGKESQKVKGRKFVQSIGKALGVTVVFEDTVERFGEWSDGYIDKNGVIHIDYNNKNPLAFLFRHEMVHYGSGSKFYKQFVNLVYNSKLFKEWLQQKTKMPEGTSVDRMAAKYMTMVAKSRKGVEELSETRLQEEMVADFAGSDLFTAGGSGLAAMSTEFDTKQRNVVSQYIADVISWIKKKINKVPGAENLTFELSRLEDTFNRMISDAKQNPTERELKHSKPIKGVAKGKKTVYNEYATNVMRWANSAGTNVGDVKIFNDRGKEFVLNEATEDGYIEIARGNYKEVSGYYEEMRQRADNSFYEYTKQIRAKRDGSMRTVQHNNRIGRHTLRNSGPSGSRGLQTDTAGDNEYLRTGNKRKTTGVITEDGKAELNDSAFSMPENIRRSVPVGIPKQLAIVTQNFNVAMRDGETRELFQKAKNGDEKSAILLAEKKITDEILSEITANFGDCFLVSVTSVQGLSDNILPSSLAKFIGTKNKLSVITGIYKTSKNEMKAKDVTERLREKITFDIYDNEVYNTIKGKDILIIDDVITTSHTTNSLAKFLTDNGANVRGVFALFKGKDSVKTDVMNLAITPEELELLNENDERVRPYVPEGTEYRALTTRMAKAIIRKSGIGSAKSEGKGDFGRSGETNKQGHERIGNIVNEAELNNSAFSMPKNIRRSVPVDSDIDTDTDTDNDIIADFQKLNNEFNKGNIEEEIYIQRVAELYEEIVKKHGRIKPGEVGKTKYQDIPVPKKIDKKTKVQRHVRTILEGGELTDEMVSTVKADILSGEFNYTPTSNKKNIAYAEDAVMKGAAVGIWERAINGDGLPTATDIAVGEALLKLAVDPLADVLRKSIIGRNTEIYKRTRDFNTFINSSNTVDGIGTDRVNADVYNTSTETDGVDGSSENGYNNTVNGANIGGNVNGSTNTELLAGGKVSAVGGSDNSVREQSANTRKINSLLGDRTGTQEVPGQRRAGSEGWLSQGTDGTTGDTFSRDTSFLGNLRRVALKNIDSVERKISETLMNRLRNTVLKTKDGTIISLFHFTDAEFENFAQGDIGFHFGTLDAAINRENDPNRTKRGDKQIYKEVYLNIENPIILESDPMKWNTFSTSHLLLRQGILTIEDLQALEKLEGFHNGKYGCEAVTELIRLINSKGYDGIIYTNGIEGGLSVIAFDPNQITTVAENGILKENSGVSEADLDDKSAFSMDENGASQSGAKGITEPDISKDTRSHEEQVVEKMSGKESAREKTGGK